MADITSARLSEELAYLAVVLDGFSRLVIGWSMAAHLQPSLAREALEVALRTRELSPGRVHHSDCGAQCACEGRVQRLEQALSQSYANAQKG